MSKFHFKTDLSSPVLKFQQLIDAINNAINQNTLHIGDPLPSVNQLIKESSLSRDTIFKAYAELKRRGIIESIPNKGYFVARNQQKVFLFLDTFKSYKEVLYGSFKKHLPPNTVVDLNFHHYNPNIFESTIEDSIGKFNTFIIMGFDHPKVAEILNKIDPHRLLVIDWEINSNENQSKVYQDFTDPVYNCFKEGVHLLKKYSELVCIYPEYTFHPYDSVVKAKEFCDDHQIKFMEINDPEQLDISAGKAFLVFEDRDLAAILETAIDKKLEIGKDIGIISYNDTPMKKFIANGITTISTDFKEMGRKAAEFITNEKLVNVCIPTKLIIRESL